MQRFLTSDICAVLVRVPFSFKQTFVLLHLPSMRIAGKPPFPPRVHSFLLASSSSASLRCRGMHLSSLAGFRW